MTKATASKTTIGTLNATTRDAFGKGAARSLRREGKVPAILYSKGKQPISLSLKLNDVTQEYMRGRFRSRLIDIALDGGKAMKALPKDIQFHPITDIIEHVDFIHVESGARLNVMIPVKFSGHDKCVGVKRGGVLNVVRHEIEFVCTPETIPTHIEVNVREELDIGSSIHINDVTLPAGIEAVIKRNFTIATIAGRSSQMEEETKPPVETVVEGEVAEGAEGEATPGAEGTAAAPAEGAKKDDGKKEGGKK